MSSISRQYSWDYRHEHQFQTSSNSDLFLSLHIKKKQIVC